MKNHRNEREFALYEAEYRVRHNEPRYRPDKFERYWTLPWILATIIGVGLFGGVLLQRWLGSGPVYEVLRFIFGG